MACTYRAKPALLVPALTPFDADNKLDTGRFVAHCKHLLAEGANGLAVFGTTSEANSLSRNERQSLLEELIEAGVDPAALMPGVGCCATPDTIELTRHAVATGCSGVLIMPPFFYRAVIDDGVLAVFSEIIEQVSDNRLQIYLYHFPKMSGVAVTSYLIEQLLKRYPDTIAGVKDSAGVWAETKSMINNFPSLDIFSGSESYLLRNLRAGGAGCISATANVNAAAISELISQRDSNNADQLQQSLTEVRAIFEKRPLIQGTKAFLAKKLNDPNWAQVRPPLFNLSAQETDDLCGELAQTHLA